MIKVDEYLIKTQTSIAHCIIFHHGIFLLLVLLLNFVQMLLFLAYTKI